MNINILKLLVLHAIIFIRTMLSMIASKLALGYPATAQGASSGYIAPSSLHDLVASLRTQGVSLGGMMTWNIGWDQQAGFPWAKAMSNL